MSLPVGVQRLLAYLALGGPVARPAAAGALWPEIHEDRALASLRTAMWRANRRIPDVVRTARTGVGLAERVRVDVDELVGGAGPWLDPKPRAGGEEYAATDAGLGPVWRHSHAELLPGWYEDWVIFERERLRHLRLHAMEAFAAHLVETGRYAVALDCALEAVRCEPLRESAHRVVISAHLGEGNVSEALHAFEAYRAMLHEQLGLDCSPELHALMQAGVHEHDGSHQHYQSR